MDDTTGFETQGTLYRTFVASRPSTVIVSPCVGCGFCCMKVPCHMSPSNNFGWKHCVCLRWDEDQKQYRCGLMEIPDPVGEYFRKEIYAGAGCCMALNTWRQGVRQRSSINDND